MTALDKLSTPKAPDGEKKVNYTATDQLEYLDDARRSLEVADVEPDLEGLGVGAGVSHHGHVGLGGRLWGQRPVTVGVHHPQLSSVPGQMTSVQ